LIASIEFTAFVKGKASQYLLVPVKLAFKITLKMFYSSFERKSAYFV